MICGGCGNEKTRVKKTIFMDKHKGNTIRSFFFFWDEFFRWRKHSFSTAVELNKNWKCHQKKEKYNTKTWQAISKFGTRVRKPGPFGLPKQSKQKRCFILFGALVESDISGEPPKLCTRVRERGAFSHERYNFRPSGADLMCLQNRFEITSKNVRFSYT